MLKSNFYVDSWDDDIEGLPMQIRKLNSEEILIDTKFLYEFTSQDKENIKRAFYKYDKKKAGFVQIDFIPDIFRLAGQNPSLRLEKILIDESNSLGYGVIFLNDMMNLFQKYWKSHEVTSKELRDAFELIESSEEGKISLNELKNNLMKYGEVLDKNNMQLFAKVLDPSGEGELTINEAMKILVKTEKQPETVKQKSNKSQSTKQISESSKKGSDSKKASKNSKTKSKSRGKKSKKEIKE